MTTRIKNVRDTALSGTFVPLTEPETETETEDVELSSPDDHDQDDGDPNPDRETIAGLTRDDVLELLKADPGLADLIREVETSRPEPRVTVIEALDRLATES